MPKATITKTATALKLIEHLQGAPLNVQQKHCVAVRNRNASCRRCASACAPAAVTVADNTLTVTNGSCKGCGVCTTLCPTGALEATQPSDAELLTLCCRAAQGTEGIVYLACERLLATAAQAYDPKKVAKVVCLGRVDESLMLSLVNAGAAAVVLLAGECEQCEHKAGFTTAEQVCQTTTVLLGAWQREVPVLLTQQFAGQLPQDLLFAADEGYDPSRRGFFTDVSRSVRLLAARAAEGSAEDAAESCAEGSAKNRLSAANVAGAAGATNTAGAARIAGEGNKLIRQKVGANGILPQFLPKRRERILEQLALLGTPKDTLAATRLWGQVDIDTQQCNSCLMCATFCPTGALAQQLSEDGSRVVALAHTAALCVKCGCCEDVCRTQALRLTDEVRAAAIAQGEATLFLMTGTAREREPARQILHSLQKLLGVEQLYER